MLFFRDLVQKVLKEGRLQFVEKPKSSMQVDADPLHVKETNYGEPFEVLMFKATESL